MTCTKISRERPILVWPPEQPLPDLPDCEKNTPQSYPAMMAQWHWGVQCYYDNEKQLFITQQHLQSDFAIAGTEGPLIQLRIDGFEIDLGRNDLAWGWMWAGSANNNRGEIHRQMIENDAADDLNFWLTDYAIDDLTTAGRSHAVINTRQQPRLKCAQVYQVANVDGYRQVFDMWKQAGFVGAVCQALEAQFADVHYLSDLWI
jgi:hypothetical protein